MLGPDDLLAIFDASPNPYMVLDRELRYVAANKAYLAVTGRRLDELLGKRLLDVFPHDPSNPGNDSSRMLLASLRTVLQTRRPDVLALIPYRINDEDHAWSATHTPILDERGEVKWILQHTVNVTAVQGRSPVDAGVLGRAELVQKANAQLDARLSELRRVFELAPVAFCVLRGPSYRIELVNSPVLQMWGRTRELVLNLPLFEAMPELAGQGLEQMLASVRNTGLPFVGSETLVKVARAEGGALEDVYFNFVYQPVFDDAGAVEAILVVAHDATNEVSARKKLEQDIVAAHRAELEINRLAAVLDATRDFVGIALLDGKPIFVNDAGRRLVGLPEALELGETRIRDYFVERQRAKVLDEVLPAALRDGYWEGELLFRHFQTGEELPVLYSLFPLKGPDGKVTALATITRDLRAQKRSDAERARLLQNAQVARAQAEEASRLKDEFLATVSHELRTPLTSMLGWVQMLKAGLLPEEKRARALETVERNARVQAQLIEDLLDVSRIISGKLALELEPTELAGVVAAAVETVRPAAAARGVALELSVEAGGQVMGDAKRLQQVVWNLLANAVKFTARDGKVRVELSRALTDLEIQVSDTGVGISPEFLPHVFERFRQEEGSTARKAGGLGLGLAIVRHLVEAHGGEVFASSEGVGRGSLFTVRLPLLDRPWRERQPPAPPAEWVSLEGVRVLVVDDEVDTREYVRALLQGSHATVSEAGSAREGLERLRRERPDVLISDIAMPGEDGYQLMKCLRALPEEEGGNTPALALTAFARMADRSRAMQAGFQHHVTKPIEPAELLAAVASLSGRQRQGAQS